MNVLRWFLVVPTGIVAWYATFIVGIVVHGLVESALCPDGEMVSGMCTNPRVQQALDAVVVVFVAISAAAVIRSAVAVAPSQRARVAWLVFGGGAALAIYFAVATGMYVSGVAAVLAGVLTAVVVSRRTGNVPRDPAPPSHGLVA